MSCESQLNTAKVCVEGDAAACSCFVPPFDTVFPEEIKGAYRRAMAFENPGEPLFCDQANMEVCTVLETTANCCCGSEISVYVECAFQNELNLVFGAGDCPHKCLGGGDGGEGGGLGSMMMIIIIASAAFAVLLICCCGGFFYCRRKNHQNLKKSVDTKDGKSTPSGSLRGDRDVEFIGESRAKADRASTARNKPRGFEFKYDDYKRQSKRDFDSDSDETHLEANRHKKPGGKMARRGSRRGFYSDSDDESRVSYDRSRKKGGKQKRCGSKKGFDSASKGRRNSKRGFDSESDSESNDKKKKLNRRGSKKGMDADSSDDDRKAKRRGSKKDIESESSEEDRSRKSERKKNKKKSKSDDSNHSDEEKEREPTVEESVRQARTILKSVKQSKDGYISVEVREAMNSEMSAVIAQLKAQREEMEKRLREAEIEATRLHIEKEISKRHIIELETRKNETENRLEETKKEAKMVQATSVVEVANKESEKILVVAELQQVQQEREEMSKMIKKLERAKGDMEGRLRDAQDEAQVLKVERDVVTKRVTEAEQQREALRVKLSQIERTRGDIETRMKEAEEELKELRAEKKFKTKEIRDMRASEHSRSILFEAEDERKNITQNLKKISEEKEDMRAMMAQLDSSRRRLQDIMDETPEDINDEMSIDIVAQSMGMDGSQANQRDPYSVYPQTPSTPSQPARGAGVSPVLLSQSMRNYTQQSKAMGDMPKPDNRRNELSMKDLHVGEERVALANSLQFQQEQRPQPPRRRNGLVPLDHNDEEKMPQGELPAGWLGHTISNRSFKDVGEGGDAHANWLGDSIHFQQEQRPQPKRRRNSSATLDHDDEEEIPQGERPAGWLGHNISNRSFNDLNTPVEPRGAAQEASSRRRDPSTRSRQAETQETAYESQNLRSKREKARSAERRLRQEMERSNRSMGTDDGSSDGMDGLTIDADEKESQEVRISKG